MKDVEFSALAFEQLEYWEKHNSKVYMKIEKLVDAIQQSPFSGIGKPEALKHELTGYWSRRITKADRLVYD